MSKKSKTEEFLEEELEDEDIEETAEKDNSEKYSNNEDDDEADDGDYDDYSDEEDSEEYRRQMRHSRRVKSQVISYLIIGLVIALIVVGIFFLVRQLVGLVTDHNEKKQVEQEIEEMTETEEEDITIEAPDTTEEEPEEEVESTDYLGDMVSSVISEMSTEDKVAQLFMITPEELTGVNSVTQAGDSTQEALNTYAVAGLVYDSDNIDSADQLTTMLTAIQGMSKYELWLAVKEPGGETDSVSSKISEVASVEGPAAIAESGDSAQAYSAGTTIAGYLTSFGFNTDIAPCGDLITDEEALSADLSYGTDESLASDMVAKMVQGLEEGSVNACLTNFPGTGSVTESTAKGTVESDISADVLTGQLVPYISGIGAGARMVQMSNVTYTAADESGVPASLSEYLIGTMLRGNMGFDGIVITGPLNEKAITDNYSAGDAAVAAINAGADIIYQPESFTDAYTAVLEAVNSGTISQDRLNEALDHIFRVKFADDVE